MYEPQSRFWLVYCTSRVCIALRARDRQKIRLSDYYNIDLLLGSNKVKTSISANADGQRDAASRKINHIARPTKYNYQAACIGR